MFYLYQVPLFITYRLGEKKHLQGMGIDQVAVKVVAKRYEQATMAEETGFQGCSSGRPS